jgi:GNAT superfamily N-acetyltransferase
MGNQEYTVRNAKSEEFTEIGNLMIRVYSQLVGFPKKKDQPEYYKMPGSIGELTIKPETELLVAVSSEGKIVGTVVSFGDMQYYGSGGTATLEKNASGFRLLAVESSFRGCGIGKLLIGECIRKAKNLRHKQVIIHSTQPMQIAIKIYLDLGFKRSEEFDFIQGTLPVIGFKLTL